VDLAKARGELEVAVGAVDNVGLGVAQDLDLVVARVDHVSGHETGAHDAQALKVLDGREQLAAEMACVRLDALLGVGDLVGRLVQVDVVRHIELLGELPCLDQVRLRHGVGRVRCDGRLDQRLVLGGRMQGPCLGDAVVESGRVVCGELCRSH